MSRAVVAQVADMDCQFAVSTLKSFPEALVSCEVEVRGGDSWKNLLVICESIRDLSTSRRVLSSHESPAFDGGRGARS